MSYAEIDTADALRGAVRARSIARREALYDEALGGGGGVTWLILTLSAILFTSMATHRAGVALLLPAVPLCLLVADLQRRLSRQQTAVVHLLRELHAGPDPLDEAREPPARG